MINESTCFWIRGERRYTASILLKHRKWPEVKKLIRFRAKGGRCVEECKTIAFYANPEYKFCRLVSVKLEK